jgi:hypothetical protein
MLRSMMKPRFLFDAFAWITAPASVANSKCCIALEVIASEATPHRTYKCKEEAPALVETRPLRTNVARVIVVSLRHDTEGFDF